MDKKMRTKIIYKILSKSNKENNIIRNILILRIQVRKKRKVYIVVNKKFQATYFNKHIKAFYKIHNKND